MEYILLPSDIARLVYGYLDEEGCAQAAKHFIETSQHLKGCLPHIMKGRKIMTKFNGLSLIELLDLLIDVTYCVKSLESVEDVRCRCVLGETFQELRCLLKLSCDGERAQKPDPVCSDTPQVATKRSPRKKKPLESNSTLKSSKLPETISEEDGPPPAVIARAFLELALENKALHEKLAENINKASEEESLEKILQKKIVENIVDNTEKDPIFEEMLEELGVAKKGEPSSSCPGWEEDPVVATSEDDTHESPKSLSSCISTPASLLGKDLVRQTTCQNSVVQAPSLVWHSSPIARCPSSVGQSSQVTSSPCFLAPCAIVDRPSDKPSTSFGCSLPSPVGTQPGPIVAKPPGVVPLNVQTVMASSTRCISATSQGPPAYVIASTSIVTPSVVFGTTFCGATVRFTPTAPSMSRVRHLAQPARQRLPSTPSPLISTIKVLASTAQASHLPPVLPKPEVQALPGGMLGQPIFHVPLNGGNPSLAPSSLQQRVATVSLTPSATPTVSQSVPTSAVKIGARTRGGKVKTYPGWKKSLQTIGPTTSSLPDESTLSQEVVPASKSDVSDKAKGSVLPAKQMKESVGNVSHDASESDVGDGPTLDCSQNEEAKKLVAGSAADVLNTVADTKKPDSEIANLPVHLSKCDAVIAESDDKVTKSCEMLPTGPCQQSSPREMVDPDFPRSETGEDSSSSNAVPCRTDATPQQGSEPKVKLRKRLSLSTPRRGSHVRTLEFKTPPKNSKAPRKSLSSPKNKAPELRLPEMQKMLESVKKSELFKSPPKKDKKEWDADLRQYTAEEDIPTSVGLKRKYSTPSKTGNASKSVPQVCTSGDSKSAEGLPKDIESTKKCSGNSPEKTENPPKTPDGKHETDEDLVIRIQRDVLAVIDEEEIADLSSASFCLTKGADSGESPKSSPKFVKSPIRSPGTSSVLEMGDIGLSASTIKKLYQRATSIDESSCTTDSPLSKAPKDTFSSPKRSQIEASKENLFASPKRSVVESPKKDDDLKLRLSPSPKLLRKDDLDLSRSPGLCSTQPQVGILSELTGSQLLETTPSPKLRMFSDLTHSPGSSSLEGALIRECSRIESLGVERITKNTVGKPSDCDLDANSVVGVNSSDVKVGTSAEKPENSIISSHHFLPPSGITPLKTPAKTADAGSDLFGITPLKTPWKPPPTAPVEMTPLSKIINEETRLGKCTLLTPTIPPTPELKDQEPAGNTNCSPSDIQKTPQSKTPSLPAAPVETPSPTRKIQKKSSKTPTKTPVVKLKKKSESSAKVQKKKLTKGSKLTDFDLLRAKCFEKVKEAMFPSNSAKRNPPVFISEPAKMNSEPLTGEESQKKKAPRNRKVPQKSEAKPKKERKAKQKKEPKAKPKKEPKAKLEKVPKTSSFQDMIESFEKMPVSSSASESDVVLSDTIKEPQLLLTEQNMLSAQSRATKKCPEKKVGQVIDLKPKNKNVNKGKRKSKEYSCETSTASQPAEPDIASKKYVEKCKLDEQSEAPLSDPQETSPTKMTEFVSSTSTPDIGSDKDVRASENLVNQLVPLGSHDGNHVFRYIHSESNEPSNVDSPRSPMEGLNPPSKKAPIERPPFPTKVPFLTVSVIDEGLEKPVDLWLLPEFTLFPPAPNVPPDQRLSPPARFDGHRKTVEEVSGSGKRRPKKSGSCSIKDVKPPQKSGKAAKLTRDRNTKAGVKSKRNLQVLSSGDEEDLPQELEQSSSCRSERVENVEETPITGNRRSRGNRELEESQQNPQRAAKFLDSNRKQAEEEVESQKKWRGSSVSEGEESPQKPSWRSKRCSRDNKGSIEGIVENRMGRSNRVRRSGNTSNSEDEEFSLKSRRPESYSYNVKNKIEDVEDRKRKRWRSRSCSPSFSEEEGSSRKRRKTDERRDHIWPRNNTDNGGRRPRGRSRARRHEGRGNRPPSRLRSRRRRYSSSEDEEGRPFASGRYSRSRDRYHRSHSPKKHPGESTHRDSSGRRHQESSKDRGRSRSRKSNRERGESRTSSEDEDHKPNKRLDSTRRDWSGNRYQWSKDCSRRSARERVVSRSSSSGGGCHKPVNRLSNSRRDRSKHRYAELIEDKDSSKRSDRSGTSQRPNSKHQGNIEKPKWSSDDRVPMLHQDDSKEHQNDRTSQHDWNRPRDRYQEPVKDKDGSRRSGRKEAMQNPSSCHQDRHSNLKEPSTSERRYGELGIDTNKPPTKPSRTTIDELEEGEISEESRNTIFQFSKNSPRSGGAADRLSSPVASESRQKLLKNVNVDKFLSLLHGDAKSPSAKEDEPALGN